MMNYTSILIFLSFFTIAEIYCNEYESVITFNTNIHRLNRRQRYLIYDVNPGEGFNLRRDVYIRIANLVHFLNELEPWILVLPPWGNLYHWQSDVLQEKLPWSHFFDVNSLKRHVPVIEFEEFLQINGGEIEETYYLQRYKEGWTKWEEKIDKRDCLDDTRFKLSADDGKWHWWFWGYGNQVSTNHFACLSVLMSATSLRHFLLNNVTGSSVLLLRGEQLIHGEYSEWSSLWWTARRSMRFAFHLRNIADKYRFEYLNSSDEMDLTNLDENWQTMKRVHGSALGGPYIAVHLRRKDFLYGHKDDVPSIGGAAKQIEHYLINTKLNTVFIATDTQESEFKELQLLLNKYNVRKFVASQQQLNELKDGGIAIIDQWICAHARFFVGTHVSTFTFRIQEEREILGFKQETTFNRLCPDKLTTCEQPTRWSIKFDKF